MEDKDTNRLEAFSDGVFAVAITLLVLDIKMSVTDTKGQLLGDGFNGGFWGALGSQWPTFVAFVMSFLTIGIMWLNHHKIFNHIKHINTGLIFFNTLLLMIIVFIPVPTAILAEYLGQYLNHPYYHAAAIFYSGTCFVMACCFNLIWRYASHDGRLLGKDIDQQAVQAISKQYAFGPFLYLIAILLALINMPASVIFQFALALFFALPARSQSSDEAKQ
jgi:uncharacterized membrane protein